MNIRPIAINARHLLKGELEGLGTFSFELIKRIVSNHPEEQFILFFDRSPDPSFTFGLNVKSIVVYPPARHFLLWHIWYQWRISQLLNKYDAKLFFSPDGFVSLHTKTPQLSVIHDLGFEHRPGDLPKNVAWYYRTYFPKFAKYASRICTVSNFSKSDIVSTYKIDESKIDVIPNGASQLFKPLNFIEKQAIKKELTGGEDYFIYVGSLHARKNIENLLNAFDLYKVKHQSKLQLLIVGKPMFDESSIQSTYKSLFHKESIHFLGYVSQPALAKYVASAKALLLLSYFEGFGLPILEAMNCDVPVIVAQASSLPEIAATAGFYVDPNSIHTIAESMRILETQAEVREQLVENGRMERQKYSWALSADLIWDSILRTLHPEIEI